MIQTRKLNKNFKIYEKKEGVLESLKSLFHRSYHFNTAVDSFDLQIAPGEIIGLLGPNGAGKTTLMKMFSGIIVPSGGELNILGHVPSQRERAFRKKIALVMGQKSQLWWDIPTMDSLKLIQRYYEIPIEKFNQRVSELSQTLQVEKLLNIHIRKLSLGERMKMELMASLLHEPEVIFLDEPTIGLDVVAQENIRKFLLKYHKEYRPTIILTSHYMADVEALCQRIVLILDGKKSFDGSLEEFEDILGKEKNVTFIFREPIKEESSLWADWDAKWNPMKTQVDLRIPDSDLCRISAEILKSYPVTDFYTEKMPIERVMKALMNNPQLIQKGL